MTLSDTAQVDGQPVTVLRGGSSDDAVPVLLVHGGGFDHAHLSWQHLFAPLGKKRGFIAPDIAGFGATPPSDFIHGVAGFGGWMVRLLDALEIDKTDACGVSLGGGIALWLALNHPDRVRHLVLIDPYGVAAKVPFQKFGALFSKVPATRWSGKLIGSSRWMARATLKSVFHDDDKVTADLAEMAQRAARETPGFATFGRFQREEVRWDGLKTCFADRLHTIEHPTLIIHGRHDALVPLADIERGAARMPNAQLEILETGHWPMLESPEAFNALVLDFLAPQTVDES